MKKSTILIIFFFMIGTLRLVAQVYDPVEWSCFLNERGTGVYELNFKAVIEPGWLIYSTCTPEGGPVPLSIELDRGAQLVGIAKETKPLKKYEELLGVEVWYHTGKCTLRQDIKVGIISSKSVRGTLTYQARKKGLNVVLEKDFNLDFDATGKPTFSWVQHWRKKDGKVYIEEDYVRYSEWFRTTSGRYGFFEYSQALKYARVWQKPLFIAFTGHGCYGWREMENIMREPSIAGLLEKEYVSVALYVDDKRKLPEEECYVSKTDGKLKNTIGRKNTDFQISKFSCNARPMYILLDSWGGDEEDLKPHLLAPAQGYTSDSVAILRYLRQGVEEYKKRQAKRWNTGN